MFEQFLMQNATVDMLWAFIATVIGAATVIIPIVRYWVTKARDSALTKENADAILNKVLEALEVGEKFVDATKNQEVKIKQLGEIVFESLPDKGAGIRDKLEVKLTALQADIQKATNGTVEYDTKLREIERILAELGIKS